MVLVRSIIFLLSFQNKQDFLLPGRTRRTSPPSSRSPDFASAAAVVQDGGARRWRCLGGGDRPTACPDGGAVVAIAPAAGKRAPHSPSPASRAGGGGMEWAVRALPV